MPATDSFVDVRFARADDLRIAARAPAEWRAKAAAKRFAKDAALELVAGGLLAEMLAAHGVAKPAFALGAFGKPELADGALRFNLSHSGDVVMCAVAGRPVGCDVEKAVPEPGRDAAFYAAWTRREAGLKMLGCGFADGADYDAPPHPAARNVPAPDGYAAAVCLEEDAGKTGVPA